MPLLTDNGNSAFLPDFTVSPININLECRTSHEVTGVSQSQNYFKTGDLPPVSSSESESESESDVTTDSQSASLSWNKAPSGAYDQIFISI
jgi:hypothetical protein